MKRRLGGGASGSVWLATDQIANVDVALKVYETGDTEMMQNELQTLLDDLARSFTDTALAGIAKARHMRDAPICRPIWIWKR